MANDTKHHLTQAVAKTALAPHIRRAHAEKILPWQLAQRVHYKLRFSNPVWFDLLNRSGRLAYQGTDIRLSPVQAKALASLESSGMAVVTFDELFPELQFAEYQDASETLVQSPENSSVIKTAEEVSLSNGSTSESHGKHYLVKLLGRPVLDMDDLWFKLALSDELLSIAAKYFGMMCRLHYLDVWYNAPSNGPAILSQHWHRDPEDRKILKAFVYLRDVDQGNGPLSYVAGSQEGGPLGQIEGRRPPYGRRVSKRCVEEQLGAAVRTFTGSAGMVVLCDTTGIHKGGHATEKARLLFTSVYTSDGVTKRSLRSRNWVQSDSAKSRAAGLRAYAIGGQ